MKKKHLLAALSLALVLTVAGCGGDSTEAPQDAETTEQVQTQTEEPAVEPADDVPQEWKNALKSAEVYSDMMNMSKQGIYDQLTSEYGDNFPAEAAQYAVDNLEADYKANALASAKVYFEEMAMSKEAIRDQLVSEYGDKFTQEEADYAVENLE